MSKEVIYPPDTIVRKKRSGEFARIKKHCWCGNNSPTHYEAWIENSKGEFTIMVVWHDEIEFEWPPKEVFEHITLAQ